MKLQVKDSGAWRNVLRFDAARTAEVEAAAAALLRAAGGLGIAMRIIDGDLVMGYCEQPACVWRASKDSMPALTASVRTWRQRIGVGADFPLHAPNDVERAMVAEIAELRAAASRHALPLDEHTQFILGRPNFTCIRAAERMRELGHEIERKAEAEQSAVIHLLLTMYQQHGAAWQEHCDRYLRSTNPEGEPG